MLIRFWRKVIPILAALLDVVIVEKMVNSEVILGVGLLTQHQTRSQVAIDIEL